MKSSILFLALIVFMTSTACNSGDKSEKNSDSNEDVGQLSIAYNVHIPDSSKDNWDIMVMNMDGSGKKNITHHSDVAWTYDAVGDRLLFISDRDSSYRYFNLYESDRNGENIRRISDLQLEDSWMSARNNGQELIVCGRIGSAIRYQLFLIDMKTGTYRQLTQDTAAMYRDPCFSPDGSRIVCSYKKSRRDRSTHEELFLLNEDGSIVQQLTRYPENNVSAKDYGYKAGSARWHPKEDFISYVSKQDGKHSIFAISSDGSRQWKLIENPESEGWHDWSPDGKWLVYNNSDIAETQYHISLMNWETKESRQLTDTSFKSQLGPVFVGVVSSE